MAGKAAHRFDVKLADGRTVRVLASGPGNGLPLVFHTGTPAGLVHYQPVIDAAAGAGLRCVVYSRPGYNGSDPQPGRLVADAAGDVAAILDHLGAGHFVTAGWSGGGPHALACAALLSQRCLAAATIGGVAPYGAAGLDWLKGMAEENVLEFGVAVGGPDGLTGLLTEAAAQLRDVTSAEIVEAFGGLVTPPDKAALTGEFADYVAQLTSAAVANGIAGWRDDDLAFVTDWGSRSMRSRCRLRSGTGIRTRWFRSATVSGWRATSPAPTRGLLTGKDTSASSLAFSTLSALTWLPQPHVPDGAAAWQGDSPRNQRPVYDAVDNSSSAAAHGG
jgi:pimeloyl-ACP methyl ester carboxylesterase